LPTQRRTDSKPKKKLSPLRFDKLLIFTINISLASKHKKLISGFGGFCKSVEAISGYNDPKL